MKRPTEKSSDKIKAKYKGMTKRYLRKLGDKINNNLNQPDAVFDYHNRSDKENYNKK
jgi:hypothetical protein